MALKCAPGAPLQPFAAVNEVEIPSGTSRLCRSSITTSVSFRKKLLDASVTHDSRGERKRVVSDHTCSAEANTSKRVEGNTRRDPRMAANRSRGIICVHQRMRNQHQASAPFHWSQIKLDFSHSNLLSAKYQLLMNGAQRGGAERKNVHKNCEYKTIH